MNKSIIGMESVMAVKVAIERQVREGLSEE